VPNESKKVEVQSHRKRRGRESTNSLTAEQGVKESYKSPANLLTIIALILSALAFASSLRSCQIAQDAQELTRRQYQGERLLVLEGEFNKEGDKVILKSTDTSLTFLEGLASFPKKISNQEWNIRPSDKTLYLSDAKFGLQRIISEKVPKKEGFAQVGLDGKIPLLIDAYYTSKGDSYLDRSLYMLSVEFVQNDKENEPASIKFTGLLFVKRFPPNAWVTKDYLDEIFEKGEGLYIPPKAP
jgi:hypothetical protein